VKKAWRRIAKDDHPDLNGGTPSPRYLAAQRAYQTLIDPSSRRSYDSTLGGTSSSSSSSSTQSGQSTSSSSSSTNTASSSTGQGGGYQNARTRPSGGQKTYTGGTGRIPRPTIAFRTSPTVNDPEFVPKVRTSTQEKTEKPPRTRNQKIALAATITAWVAMLLTLTGVVMLAGFLTFPGGWSFLTAMAVLGLATIQFFNLISLTSGAGTISMALAIGFASGILWIMPGHSQLAALAGAIHAAACIVYCAVTPAKFRTRADTQTPMDEKTSQFAIFGRPASGLVDKFGESGEIGALGERATAELLEQQLLPHLPGARIFYGLKMFPGTASQADVDFAVLYGRKLALGDAKVWRSGTYAVSDYPNASEVFVEYEDGSESVREIHMNAAADAYILHLEGYAQVQPYVVVHPPHGNGVRHTFHNAPNNRMRIGSPEDIFNEMVDWLLDQPEHSIVIDRRLMARVARVLK
jgi:hypothetical protein